MVLVIEWCQGFVQEVSLPKDTNFHGLVKLVFYDAQCGENLEEGEGNPWCPPSLHEPLDVRVAVVME